jgi:hypothetical protein
MIYLGKNTVKGGTETNGHFLKLHFCIFEKATRENMFLDVQNIQTFKVDNPYFFQNIFFFLPNMHHSF